MSMFIKRTLALVAVLAIALSAAACGGSKDGGASAGGANLGEKNNVSEFAIDSDAVLATMPEELKGTTIEFLNWYDPDAREEKVVIDEFEQKTGITVTYRLVDYSKYINTVSGLISVGETPDVMRVKKAEIGALKLLQPISEATGFDFSDKAWDKEIMDMYSVNGKCYGANLVYTPFFLPGMIFYNTETMEEMGFEDPYELWKQGKWTWEKLKEMCTTWVNQGTEYTGANLYATAWAMTVNADFVKYDGSQYTLDLNNQKAIEKWKWVQEGVKNNLFTNLNDGFDQAQQKLLFSSMDATAVQQSSGYFNKTRLRKQLAGVAYPVWEGEKYYLPMMENIAFCIPKAAKNPKAVPYFIAYMANFANYNQGVGEGGFFFNEQVKECYLELMTLPNRATALGNEVFSATGEISNAYWNMYFKVDPTQLQTWLQEREYIFQNGATLLNNDLAKLG